uniref:Band_3_cyto domain-containing protein n=1 Tax=Steinernema glaseri TaxID=37863 RepID=A0A1I7ZR42_9BILA
MQHVATSFHVLRVARAHRHLGHSAQYREIGRAIATLMSDEIFHDVAYKARNRTDLLDGVDEFLDQVTVLPLGKGESLAEERTKPTKGIFFGSAWERPALKRTGLICADLILDIKRKLVGKH